MGDFNIAPTHLDIHNPEKYEGGIMASEIERKALNNVLKGRLIDFSGFLKTIPVIELVGLP